MAIAARPARARWRFEAGFPIQEAAVVSVSAAVSVGTGSSTPVICAGSQSSLPLTITCDDTVNHLHLRLIVQ